MRLPKGWHQTTLGEHIDLLTGYPFQSERYSNHPEDTKLLRGDNIMQSYLRWEDVKRWPQSESKDLARYELQEGDLVVAMDRPWVKAGLKHAVLNKNDLPCFLVQRVARIRGAKSLTTSFIVHVVASHRFTQHVKGIQTETAIPHISAAQIQEFTVPLPPLPEQHKIADILTTWDEALTQLDALIEALELRKEALMQQMLTPVSTRSGGKHVRQRMGEVLERVTRRNSLLNDNVLTISAQGGLVSQKEYFNRSVAGADLSGYYLMHRGEFAYNRSYSKGYPYGALKRLEQFDAGVVSTLYLCFRIKVNAPVSPEYLMHYFEGGCLNSGLRCIAKEGARAHGLLNVTSDEFFDLDLFLPSLPEQQKIAAVLDTADKELALLRDQRRAMDQQKRGLMQRLLTGDLRVKI